MLKGSSIFQDFKFSMMFRLFGIYALALVSQLTWAGYAASSTEIEPDADGRTPTQIASATETQLIMAAQGGLPQAQYNLGRFYFLGRGVRKDYGKALNWYRRAARQGHIDAQLALADMFLLGKGIPRDASKAILWLQMAGERGHAPALYNLGRIYALGDGVPSDLVQAYKWINLSGLIAKSAKVRDKSVQALASLSARMTTAQLSEAKRLVREWWSKHEPNGK